MFELARHGNKEAILIIEEVAYYLARGLAGIMHIVDPDIFILGGGVMQSKDVLMPLLENKVKVYVYDVMKAHVNIVPAALERPGIIGASLLPRMMCVTE